jgi:hypothetical protein
MEIVIINLPLHPKRDMKDAWGILDTVAFN